MADAMDAYVAIWLGLECAKTLRRLAPDQFNPLMNRYSSTVHQLGYEALTRRFASVVCDG